MTAEIIYLDNAATSSPKPEPVYETIDRLARAGGSAGRGAHRASHAASAEVFDARESLADFLGAPSAERLVFTPGCTFAINMVLKGMRLTAGDIVLVTALEHNSVMRPLAQLAASGVQARVLPYAPGEIVARESLIGAIAECKPKLMVLCEGSNVTGEVADLRGIAEICAARGVPLLVDAAQTAGRESNVLATPGITFWAAPAHKSFYGISGLGLLYVSQSADLEPLVSGGTGSQSELSAIPSAYPDHLEAGTLPVVAIGALAAGVRFIRETSPEKIRAHESALLTAFIDWAGANPAIELFGDTTAANHLPLVSFRVRGMSCDRVADLLDTEYGIAVRAGLHCCSAAHRALGTIDHGTVRASFGYFNSSMHVEQLCSALDKLARASV